MLFNSVFFLLFFPIVTLIYYALRKDKIRKGFLLLASYFFYMCWDARFGALILYVTYITYAFALRIEPNAGIPDAKRKHTLWLGAVLTLLPLFIFKYLTFTLELGAMALRFAHVNVASPALRIILPVGISFFSFQALGYLIDVYRGTIPAERSFTLYALFISFFPQLVAGPIERSSNLLRQLKSPVRFSFDRAYEGLLLMLWGFFLKIVLADRIAIFVDAVYLNYGAYPGYYLLIATLLFAVQIYCDFAGYTVIAMGCAGVLGISLMDNFNAPYLACSVADFWRRWHISLTTWFKDYLYFPLGGNRKGKLRKYVNKMIVFLVSGLWHGASLSFVVWGGLNGLYQVVGEVLTPAWSRLGRRLGISGKTLSHRVLRMITTFLLIDFSWIFFRASSLSHAIEIVRCLFRLDNPWIFWDGSLYSLGLDRRNFILMLLAIAALFAADIAKARGIRLRKVVMEQDIWAQVLLVAFAVCFLLIFGIWGPAFNANNFIYFQF